MPPHPAAPTPQVMTTTTTTTTAFLKMNPARLRSAPKALRLALASACMCVRACACVCVLSIHLCLHSWLRARACVELEFCTVPQIQSKHPTRPPCPPLTPNREPTSVIRRRPSYPFWHPHTTTTTTNPNQSNSTKFVHSYVFVCFAASKPTAHPAAAAAAAAAKGLMRFFRCCCLPRKQVNAPPRAVVAVNEHGWGAFGSEGCVCVESFQ